MALIHNNLNVVEASVGWHEVLSMCTKNKNKKHKPRYQNYRVNAFHAHKLPRHIAI